MPISTPLRTTERPGHRNRFLAACMVIVEAPRLGPSSPAPLRTLCKAPQSTPSFKQKVASSDAIAAATAAGDMFLSGTLSRS